MSFIGFLTVSLLFLGTSSADDILTSPIVTNWGVSKQNSDLISVLVLRKFDFCIIFEGLGSISALSTRNQSYRFPVEDRDMASLGHGH